MVCACFWNFQFAYMKNRFWCVKQLYVHLEPNPKPPVWHSPHNRVIVCIYFRSRADIKNFCLLLGVWALPKGPSSLRQVGVVNNPPAELWSLTLNSECACVSKRGGRIRTKPQEKFSITCIILYPRQVLQDWILVLMWSMKVLTRWKRKKSFRGSSKLTL